MSDLPRPRAADEERIAPGDRRYAARPGPLCDYFVGRARKCPNDATRLCEDVNGVPHGFCEDHWPKMEKGGWRLRHA